MNETNDSRSALLRPAQLVAVWGVGERQVRKILSELESLGFKLQPGEAGIRLCPPQLAAAVKSHRAQRKELSALRLDPSVSRFLTPGAAGDGDDAFAVLVYVATELGVLREAVATMANAMQTGAAVTTFRPFSWENAGIPNPKHSL